jgi:hypothetical protein
MGMRCGWRCSGRLLASSPLVLAQAALVALALAPGRWRWSAGWWCWRLFLAILLAGLRVALEARGARPRGADARCNRSARACPTVVHRPREGGPAGDGWPLPCRLRWLLLALSVVLGVVLAYLLPLLTGQPGGCCPLAAALRSGWIEPAVWAMFDVEAVRRDFPILSRQVNGKPLVYLDNGASAQKPQVVIDAVTRAYSRNTPTSTGGCITCPNLATEKYEAVRGIIARFLNAAPRTRSSSPRARPRGSTWSPMAGPPRPGPGRRDRALVMEHHANIVPWHFLRERQGWC